MLLLAPGIATCPPSHNVSSLLLHDWFRYRPSRGYLFFAAVITTPQTPTPTLTLTLTGRVYLFFTVVMLMNMLIAMMAKTL